MFPSNRLPTKFLAFFLMLGFLCLSAYGWWKKPLMLADADEVRVYRSSSSFEVEPHVLVRLQGDAAQEAVRNFNFTQTGIIAECLEPNGWFHFVFSGHWKEKSFDVYLPIGQMESDNEIWILPESSRSYWERMLVKRN